MTSDANHAMLASAHELALACDLHRLKDLAKVNHIKYTIEGEARKKQLTTVLNVVEASSLLTGCLSGVSLTLGIVERWKAPTAVIRNLGPLGLAVTAVGVLYSGLITYVTRQVLTPTALHDAATFTTSAKLYVPIVRGAETLISERPKTSAELASLRGQYQELRTQHDLVNDGATKGWTTSSYLQAKRQVTPPPDDLRAEVDALINGKATDGDAAVKACTDKWDQYLRQKNEERARAWVKSRIRTD